MGEFDSTTWQAVGLTLTVLGLALSVLLWRRRGAASGLRAAAWALLPLAAALTGVLRLVWEVTDSVLTWATRLVFSPTVWIGIAVTGVAAGLFAVSGLLRRRTSRKSPRSDASLPATRSSAPAAQQPSGSGAADDDMDDIEAILRKHGIG